MTANPNVNTAVTRARQQKATRIIFLIAGLGMASWAPLIPFAKDHLHIGEGALGLLLFCIAAGSMLMMPFTGMLIERVGYRAIIAFCSIALCIILPSMMVVTTPVTLGLALLFFGAVNGVLDVTMNAQAVVVEQQSEQAMMSGFHGFYSLGSIVGAGGVSVLLWMGMTPFSAVIVIASAIMVFITWAFPRLLQNSPHARIAGHGVLWALTHRPILIIAVVCFFIFLTEGAVLDWSAVFMTTERDMAIHLAGLGYTLYSLAVALGRFYGDRVINKCGAVRTLLSGSLLAAAGLFILIATSEVGIALIGLMLMGAGLSNIIPILFSAAGNQPGNPADFAIPAVTLFGYAGLLAGPALIGFVAQHIGLSLTFSVGLCILLAVSISASHIVGKK